MHGLREPHQGPVPADGHRSVAGNGGQVFHEFGHRFYIKYTQALLLFELLTMDNDPLFYAVSYSFHRKLLGLPVDFPAGFIILCGFIPSSDRFYGVFLCWSCLTVPRNWHGVSPKPSKHFFAAARGFYGKQHWLRQDYPMQHSEQVFLFSPLGQGECSGNIPSKEHCFMLQEPHLSRQHGWNRQPQVRSTLLSYSLLKTMRKLKF